MRGLATLRARQHGQELAVAAYRLTFHASLRTHRALADQIRRSAVSVPSNLVEGYALGTTAQFRRHVRIACASACELDSQLGLLERLQLIPTIVTKPVRQSAQEEHKILVGLLRSLGARTPIGREKREQ